MIMELSKRIAQARKQKGFTQEQLAELANVTVRTIQRIENGENTPRAFTLKTIAEALDTSYEELTAVETIAIADTTGSDDHVLKLLCLSSFSYLIIPFVHFLIPLYLLKKSAISKPDTLAFGRKIVRQQIGWVALLSFVMLLTLAYNSIVVVNHQPAYILNYLWPFLILYLLNALLLLNNWRKVDGQSKTSIFS